MGDKRQGKDGNNEQEAKRLKQQEGQEDQEEEAEQITFVLVKTKTEDGGSPVASSASRNGRDAFLHYSNDAVCE